ncbi:MAG: hypothetical protein AAGE84_09555 [Cyanobacteria bacterium P01_G01_bin.39]
MSYSNADNSKLSRSKIVELFNNNESLDDVVTSVNITTESRDNNGFFFIEKKKKGNCLIFKLESNHFLIPSKKIISTSHEYNNLELVFLLDERKKVQNVDFIVKEPAKVDWDGKYWRLNTKGTLNFGDNSASHSVDFQEKSNSNISKTTNQNRDTYQLYEKLKKEKAREIKYLEKKIGNLEEELEQEKNRQATIQEKQHNIQSESIEKLIAEKISKYFEEQFPVQFASANETLINLIFNKIAENTKTQLSSIKEDIEVIKNNHSLLENEIEKVKKIGMEHLGYSKQLISSYHPKLANTTPSSFAKYQEIEKLDSKLSSISQLVKDIQDIQNSSKSIFERKIIDQSELFKNLIKELEGKIIRNQPHNMISINQEFQNQFESIKTIVQESNLTLISLKEENDNINQRLDYITQYITDPDNNFTNKLSTNSNFDSRYASIDSNAVYFPQLAQTNRFTDVESLTGFYNKNPRALSNRVAKVAATRESIEQRRSGIKTPLIFKENDNDSYWIVNEFLLPDNSFYLLPKANLIINDRIYQTVEYIFTCQGYEYKTSNNFELRRPAVVRLSADFDDQWELVQPGELVFS